MKQATKGLLKAAATAATLAGILLMPPFESTASAQKKKPSGNTTAPTPPAPPAAGAAGGNDLEIDDPNAPKAPTDPNGGTPAGGDPNAAGGAGAGGGAGGICEIDPSACPKGGTDLKTAAGKDVSAEVYAVQQIYALRYHRIELMPYWSLTLNDQFVNHPGPGLGANFYVTNVLAVGVSGTFYQGLNSDSEFNFQNRRATRVAVPLNEYQWNANLNVSYVPVYGKFAGFSDFIFHYDLYVVGGLGVLSTRPLPVIDPDNRNFAFEPKLAFNGGLGLRIFFNRWFAADLEVRDYVYNEKLENLTIAATQQEQQNKSTWFGESKITNNVQAQLGISVFLPFSWEYRLPK
jgi:outer membrane beta-barrel protein